MAVGRRQGRIVAALARAAAPLALPAAAAAASAVPYCEPQPPRPEILYSQLGLLESALVDDQGRLFVTSQSWDGPTHGAVLRIDQPGAKPVPIARRINSPPSIGAEMRAFGSWKSGTEIWLRAPSGPAVTVPGLVTVKQRTILVALRDAQHANDAQPVGTVAVARWCPEPWTCRVGLVAAVLLALQAHGLAVCVSERRGRTWRLTEAGRRQLVPRRGPAPACDRRITAR